jgi:hypothetical protein
VWQRPLRLDFLLGKAKPGPAAAMSGKMADQAALGSSMSRNRFKRIVLYAVAGIGLLLVLIGLLFVVEQRRTQSETGAVLSAVFSQGVLHDMDKSDAGRTVTIVVRRRPECRMCSVDGNGPDRRSWFAPRLTWRANTLSDAWFGQSSRVTRASFFLNSVFSTDVSTDLRLPSGALAIFVDPSDLGTTTREFEARFPNNLGLFVVSRVGLNLNKTEALLYIEHFCGGLCGGGEYVLLRKVNGVWHVVDHHDTWVS